MAQPSIPGTDVGKVSTVYGSDGTNWIALLVSALGKLQVEIDASVLPTDAATETTLASALTALQSIQNLVGALHDVGLDELDVQVAASVLPTDAATQTTLALCLTALQKIDDLQGALASQASDLLRVEAEDGDKIHAFESVVGYLDSEESTTTSHTITTTAVASGKIQKITNIAVRNYDGDIATRVEMYYYHDGTKVAIYHKEGSTAQYEQVVWSGEIWLDASDYLSIYLAGISASETLELSVSGYEMNAP